MSFRKIAPMLALLAAGPTLATPPLAAQAPAGTSETRYCMRIEAATGSRVQTVRCWTRAQWEAQGVDVDKDWPREGVRIVT
jgi:hypothetical protein